MKTELLNCKTGNDSRRLNVNRHLITFSILFLLLTIGVSDLSATKLYWREHAISNDFNNQANWTTDPAKVGDLVIDLSDSPDAIPGRNDSCYFTVATDNPANQSMIAGGGIGTATVHSIFCSTAASYQLAAPLTVFGSVISNGNFTVASNRTVTFTGDENGEIDLGTSARIAFGSNIIINKTPDTGSIQLLSPINVACTFTFTEGKFYSNGHNITINNCILAQLSATRILDLSTTVLTLENAADNGANSSTIGTFNIHPNCRLISANQRMILGSGVGATRGNIQFLSYTANAPRFQNWRCNRPIIDDFIVDTLVVNTPLLFTTPYYNNNASDYIQAITINEELKFEQPATFILNQDFQYTAWSSTSTTVNNFRVKMNVKDIVFTPANSCVDRCALIAFYPADLKLTGSNVSTNNIIYKNFFLDSSGATLTASKADDGGANFGITWNSAPAPKDYYWIGGTGLWNEPAHWTQNSTGVADGNTCIPTAVDNVFFKDFSFTAAGQTVSLPFSASCNDITWDDSNQRGTLQALQRGNVASDNANARISLSIRGNVDFSGAQAVNPELWFVGDGSGSFTLNSGTSPIYGSYNVLFFHPGSTYTLTSNFRMNVHLTSSGESIANGNLFHVAGTLIADNRALYVAQFKSHYWRFENAGTDELTRELYLRNSYLSSYHNAYNIASNGYGIFLADKGLEDYDFTGSTFFLTGSEGGINNVRLLQVRGIFDFHNITFEEHADNHMRFIHQGNTIKKLTFDGNGSMGPATTACGFTVDSLILSPNGVYQFPGVSNTTNRRVTINEGINSRTTGCGALTVSGYSSTVPGILWNNTQTTTESALTISGAVIKDVTYEQGTTSHPELLVPNGVDLLGNTNVLITPAPPRVFYWVGDGGNWSDPTHWSLTSGTWVNSEGCLPGLQDTVYFDAGSFSAPNQVVSVDISPVVINTMIWTPEAGATNPSFSAGVNFQMQLKGSLEFAEGMTLTNMTTTTAFVFNGTGQQTFTTHDIDFGGRVAIEINNKGRFDLMGNILNAERVSKTGTENSGDFYTNDYNLSGVRLVQIAKQAAHSATVYDFGSSVFTATFQVSLETQNCDNLFSEGLSLKAPQVLITNPCPIQLKTIHNTGLPLVYDNAGAPIFVEKWIYDATTFTSPANMQQKSVVVDTMLITSRVPGIYMGPNVKLIINRELITETGDRCNLFQIYGQAANPTTIQINYCDPVFFFLRLAHVNALLGGTCTTTPQVLTVHGNNEVPGMAGLNINFLAIDVNTDYALPVKAVSCMPHTLNIGRGAMLSYQWYKGTNLSALTPIDASEGGTDRMLEITEAGFYKLAAEFAGGVGCASAFTQEIRTISEETWTAGANNTNWNDPNNWDLLTVPDACCNVIIPPGKDYYPIIHEENMEALPSQLRAVCDTITFRFGGEAKNTNRLTYTTAKIELGINSNQWYMLSAPLRNTYSGDYYVHNPNPLHDLTDGMLVYMMHFDIANYQTGASKIPYDWNDAFNTNDIELLPGQGFALFANPRNSDYDQDYLLDSDPFWFPKKDAYHNYYSILGAVTGRGADLDRDNNGRFIYEDVISAGIVPLAHSSLGAGEMVLVGNPFMAQLDFDAFYQTNQSLIYNEYKIAYGDNTVLNAMNDFLTYKGIGGDYVGTNPDPEDFSNPLTQYIPPMQSFIVYSKTTTSTDTLKADIVKHTVTAPTPIATGNLLRSSRLTDKELLYITANRGNQKSHAVLVHWNEGNKNFYPEEDSRKLFAEKVTEPVLVYLLSKDGIALDINTTNDLSEIIPIGIRTSKIGRIVLNFSGMEDFVNKKIYLHDTMENRIINLQEQNEYSFIKYDTDLFIEDRFYLSFEDLTGINDLNTSNVSVLSPSPGTIQVFSNNGQELGAIEITDVQGRILSKEAHTPKSTYNYQVGVSGVYIVRVMGETRKVIVK